MNKRKVYSYLRFSTPEQRLGDSFRRQDEDRRAWCERNGCELDPALCYEDDGVSSFRGRHAEEGELATFISMVEAKKIEPGSVLLIERLDRFSREKPLDALTRLNRILSAGIDVVTLHPERRLTRETASSWGLMEIVVAMTLSHDESAKKSEWVKASWKGRRLKSGQQNITGVCPSWLRPARPVGFEVVESKARWVRKAYELAKEGFGVGKITKKLNELTGQVSICQRKRKYGSSAWHTSYVAKLLHARTVLGEYQPHRWEEAEGGVVRLPLGDPIKDYYPSIVCEADWYAVQGELRGRTLVTGPDSARVANLFTGLLIDARSGGPVRVADKGSRGKKDVRLITCLNTVSLTPFERAVLRIFAHELRVEDIDSRLSATEQERGEVEGRLALLRHQIRDGVSRLRDKPSSSMWEVISEWEEECDRLEVKLRELTEARNGSRLADDFIRLRELLSSEAAQDAEHRIGIRNKIRRVVDRVYILVHDYPYYHNYRLATGKMIRAEVRLKTGKTFDIVIDAETEAGDHVWDFGSGARGTLGAFIQPATQGGVPISQYREHDFDPQTLLGPIDRSYESDSWRQRVYAGYMRGRKLERQGGKAKVKFVVGSKVVEADASGQSLREAMESVGLDPAAFRVVGRPGIRMDFTPLDGQTFTLKPRE